MSDQPVTRDEIRQTVIDALGSIAPEADLDNLPGDAPLRDEMELDSMDMLNFVIAIGKPFNIEIPEEDYWQLTTLDSCVEYLEEARTR